MCRTAVRAGGLRRPARSPRWHQLSRKTRLATAIAEGLRPAGVELQLGDRLEAAAGAPSGWRTGTAQQTLLRYGEGGPVERGTGREPQPAGKRSSVVAVDTTKDLGEFL